MFISDNITKFFGRKIKVINFKYKGYLNPRARARYKENLRVLRKGKFAEEFMVWLETHNTYKLRFVILGIEEQREINLIREFTEQFPDVSFYMYVYGTWYNFYPKQENLKVVYVSKCGDYKYDNTVFYGINEDKFPKCPKFTSDRPCDTCMKCVYKEVVIPQKVFDHVF